MRSIVHRRHGNPAKVFELRETTSPEGGLLDDGVIAAVDQIGQPGTFGAVLIAF